MKTKTWSEYPLTGKETADDIARLYIEGKIFLSTMMIVMGKIQRKEGVRS